jgi:hypothetical protein
MISYFKYDRGNAFLLNGSPYYGFFHIVNGDAYTGKLTNTFSQKLSAKGNFLSEFYLNQLEFDVTSNNKKTAKPFVLNSFDILNKTYLDQAFDNINSNNLLVFKNLIIQNPDLLPIDRINTHFYGLSSTDADIRNDDEPSGKKTYTHVDPFAFDSEWSYLDSITAGDFVVDLNDNFRYFCSTGTMLYTLSGSFSNTNPIVLLSGEPRNTFYIKQDTVDNRLFIVSLSGVEVLDLQNFGNCQTYNVLDSITIDIDENYKSLVKIGRNIRTEVKSDVIYFKNKYSSEIYYQLAFSDLGMDDILSLDIRDVDDLVIFLGLSGSDLYFGSFDPNNKSVTYSYKPIYDVDVESEVLFSVIDSNVFYTSHNNMIQGRMISAPEYYFGTSNPDSYFYLKDYLYGSTDENWNNIQIKYNSNSLPSNSFNNILFRITALQEYQYVLTHNIGRVYASKLDLDATYLNSIPLDIEKSYKGINCSETSFGLFLNYTMSTLVKDTLRLFALAAETYTLSGSTLTKNMVEDIDYEIKNLYINGNESINVVSIQRILSLINDIQNELIS